MDVLKLTKQDYAYVKVNSTRWLDLTDLPNEVWVYINGFEDYYMVSNYGRVKSLYHNIILRPCRNKKGYLMVRLYNKNQKPRLISVHRLVAIAFLPNPNMLNTVDHIKEVDKYECDNRLFNLRWMKGVDNTRRAIKRGTFNLCKKGSNNHNAKPVIQYDKDMKFIKQWYSIADIERELGYDHRGICQCLKGNCKTIYGYIWRYGIYEDNIKQYN